METSGVASVLIELIAEAAGVSSETITLGTNLNEDLGLDSLEFVDLMQTVCAKVKLIPEERWGEFDTVGDILKACE